MSDSVRPHRQQPTRLPCPWDSPGKNTGVGCHCLLQCMKMKSESEVAQLCPTLSDLMDCSPPGSSIHGIFQQEYRSGVPIPRYCCPNDRGEYCSKVFSILLEYSKTSVHVNSYYSFSKNICFSVEGLRLSSFVCFPITWLVSVLDYYISLLRMDEQHEKGQNRITICSYSPSLSPRLI